MEGERQGKGGKWRQGVKHVRMVWKKDVDKDEKQGNRPILSLPPPPRWPSPPRQTPVLTITTWFRGRISTHYLTLSRLTPWEQHDSLKFVVLTSLQHRDIRGVEGWIKASGELPKRKECCIDRRVRDGIEVKRLLICKHLPAPFKVTTQYMGYIRMWVKWGISLWMCIILPSAICIQVGKVYASSTNTRTHKHTRTHAVHIHWNNENWSGSTRIQTH